MKPIALAAMLAGALVAVLGCNPRVGLIVMDTYPQGATVYLNEAKVGETPVTFDCVNLIWPLCDALIWPHPHQGFSA